MPSVIQAKPKTHTQDTSESSYLTQAVTWLSDQDLLGNAHVQEGVETETEAGWLDGLFESDAEHSAGAAMGFPLLGLLAGCGGTSASPDAGLDQQLTELESRSPAFAEALAKVDRTKIHLGKSGDGTANLPGGGIQIDPDQMNDPASLFNSLAHEVGHAVQPDIQWEFDSTMTRQGYIDANTGLNLEDEAEALMMELAVREDLLKGDAPLDIGASGTTSADKLALYERYKAGDIDRDQMIKGAATLIGTETPSKTDPGVNNYVEHYGRAHADAWDASHRGTP